MEDPEARIKFKNANVCVYNGLEDDTGGDCEETILVRIRISQFTFRKYGEGFNSGCYYNETMEFIRWDDME